MRNAPRAVILSTVAATMMLMPACSGTPRTENLPVEMHGGNATVAIGGVEYQEAFNAARELLRENRFAIDRVDARRGVITTHPKRTAGFATIWDGEQSTVRQEWEDMFNEQQRVVRVQFDPQSTEGVQALVSVELYRTHRPGWRVETESMRLSTHARFRDELGNLEPASFSEPIGLDELLAERLVAIFAQRLTPAAGEP